MHIKKIKPKAGQESVWDYPRPPKLEPFQGNIRIIFNNVTILQTTSAYRVLETSHPPSYYLPTGHFAPGVLRPSLGHSMCEYKGRASYLGISVNGKIAKKAAWTYPEPRPSFSPIKDHVAVYAHMMDACYVNGEKVQAQEGDFYGGWVTSSIVGPFKGAPGTWGW
jgi:uncharacterized protein (DUF427 family)